MEGCQSPDEEAIPFAGAVLSVKYDTDNYTSLANCREGSGRRLVATATYFYGGLPGDGYTGTTTQVQQVAYVYSCKSYEDWIEDNDCENTCPFGPFDYSYITYQGGAHGVMPTCCLDFDPYDETRPDATYCGDWYASCDCLSVPVWGALYECPLFASGYDMCQQGEGVRILGACQAQGPIPEVRSSPPLYNNQFPDNRFWINGGIYPG